MALLIVCSSPQDEASAQARPLPTRKLDVSVHRADIRDVLRLFAEVGDVNVVYGEDVAGQVTFRLRDVRWDHALRAILQTRGLGMEWDGRILRVATIETLDRERASRVAERETCEETAPLHTRTLRLSHARASDVAPIVRARLTARGSVEVDERTNSLIVRDVACGR